MVSWDGTVCLDVTGESEFASTVSFVENPPCLIILLGIDGVDADGTKLQVYFCTDGNTEQQWVFNSDFTIQWKDHNKCIDLPGELHYL